VKETLTALLAGTMQMDWERTRPRATHRASATRTIRFFVGGSCRPASAPVGTREGACGPPKNVESFRLGFRPFSRLYFTEEMRKAADI